MSTKVKCVRLQTGATSNTVSPPLTRALALALAPRLCDDPVQVTHRFSHDLLRNIARINPATTHSSSPRPDPVIHFFARA